MCENHFNNLLEKDLEYENIHSHSYYSNIMTPDSIISRRDVASRAKELGHHTLSCLEHGYCGNLHEAYDIAKEFDLNLIFGTEFYYVKDRFEKDRTNSHVLVVAKNEAGREEITSLISEANTTGYYLKPRIDEELLFSLTPENVIVTTACIASPVNLYDEEYAIHFMSRGKEHFGDNFFIEIQPHTNEKQQEYHRKLLRLSDGLDIDKILGVDTHYIYEGDGKYRDIFLRSSSIYYPEEDGFIMDYPSVETLIDRFSNQKVITPQDLVEAMNSTLIVRDFEFVKLDKEIKMPSLYPDLTHEEKVKKLRKIINEAWKKDRVNIPKERWKEYIQGIQQETKVIEETHMEDYFLLNQKVIKKATKEYGGVLTRTGRGSAPSSYVNKLLGFTEIDRFEAPVTLFPSRFMSKSRILETKSLPDVDFNTSNSEPFMKATRDYLGDDNAYQMIAYGTLRDKDAVRSYGRGIGVDVPQFVSDDLDSYRNSSEWGSLIKESERFIGVVKSFSPHPCAVLLLSEPISKKVGIIRSKEGIPVCLIDSGKSDEYKYLKNDYLIVTVWKIIEEVYKEIGMPIDDVRQIRAKIKDDEKVWKLYEDGMVATLNQAGTNSGRPQVMQYKPRTDRELSMWVAGIRPSFASLKSTFLNRQPFSYGIKELDDLLQTSDNFILFQENIMAVLQYVGFHEDETYGLLKAISKKKEGIIEPIHDRFIAGFVEKTGSEENALKVWQVIEDAVGYGFNSSHAYSVAIDSLYGAYLKANFPVQYFATVLNIYNNNKDKQAYLIKELDYFGITLKGLVFGKTRSNYTYDIETKTIYKSLTSVAYLNESVSERLYELSQEKDYSDDDWIDLVVDIINNRIADTRQMNILIRLGYFDRFGEQKVLLETYNSMVEYHDKKPNPVILDGEKLVIKYSRTHKEATRKTRITNAKRYYELVKQNKDLLKDITVFDKLQFEIDKLGYPNTIDPNLSNDRYVVLNVNSRYTPIYNLYNLKNGVVDTYRLDKRKAFKKTENNPYGSLIIGEGDVIEIIEIEERPKNVLGSDGKWQKDYSVMNKYLSKARIIEKHKK